MTVADRVRAMVLRHARDAEDAAELLDMLGLGDGQADSLAPRTCSGQPARRWGMVHALSDLTEARLALSDDVKPEPAPPVVVAAPAPAGAAAVVAPPARTATDRRCEGCEKPVVPQTQYRLDPAGYRARGVRLLAAKDRCHSCYNRMRRPAATAAVGKPKKPRREAKTTLPTAERVAVEPVASGDELGRWMLALVQANRELGEARAELTRRRDLNVDVGAEVAANVVQALEERDAARAECGRLAGLLEEAVARVDELARQVEQVIATADRLVVATTGQDEHVHTYPWPNQRTRPHPCECGQPWPAGPPPLADEAKLRQLREAHAAFVRGERDEWVVDGERAYQRERKRLSRWRSRGAVETQRRRAG